MNQDKMWNVEKMANQLLCVAVYMYVYIRKSSWHTTL